jgi:8-oxo-dGTP pyrophosphatase MutT (NUDIX family)
MYVSDEEIARMERRYGTPRADRFTFEMTAGEWKALRKSQTGGRAHDVTLFVIRDGRLAAIAKHAYPPGLYRAPSGGLLPGETMEAGIAREMLEETGITARLTRYLLRVGVDFTHRGEMVAWTTHVFAGEYVSGEIGPRDRKEIREARWVPLEDLSGPIRDGLIASGSSGLRYRARLHERVMEILGEER